MTTPSTRFSATRALILAALLVLPLGNAWAADPPEFLFQWGSNGSAPGQFSGPHGVEVDEAGNVYVADTGNNRIQMFSRDGVFLLEWGAPGVGPGQFLHPHGIGIGPTGDVYVAETGNNRVQRFTSNGVFLTTWGSFGAGDGQFQHNHGLAVDAAGNVFVADRDQNRVQKFASDGTFLLAWGTFGTADGEFTGTNGVAVDRNGNVFVSDSSPRIQKFANDGSFIASWGSAGVGDGQFDFPRGLSTDEAGDLYVADRNNHRMQKFTGTGSFLARWGSSGSGAGEFNLPYAVRAGLDGLVYVADTSNHRVQVFGCLPNVQTYCTGKTNSLGCVPFITITGTPSESDPTPFRISGNEMALNEVGILLYSVGKANLGFHGGKLCVKAPFKRTSGKQPIAVPSVGCPVVVDLAGQLNRNFNNVIQSGNDPMLTSSRDVFAQWIQRDPSDPAGFGDSLTDGVRFRICP